MPLLEQKEKTRTFEPTSRPQTQGPRTAIFESSKSTQEELAASYNHKDSQFLYGSKIKYTTDGRIILQRFMPATGEDFRKAKPEGKIPENKRATPGSPHSRLPRVSRREYVEVADVETAIRMVDHIKAGTHGKERSQARAVAAKADQLLQEFGLNWRKVAYAEMHDLNDILSETYALLAQQGLDPDNLENYVKQRMAEGLIKGSSPYDSRGRLNYMATIKSLTKAYNGAMKRKQELARIDVKYEGAMQTALRKEREISRGTLEVVKHYADPKVGITKSVLFRSTSRRDQRYQARAVALLLDRLESQMQENIHMNSYKQVAKKVSGHLAYARLFLEEICKQESGYDVNVILQFLKEKTFPTIYKLTRDGLEKTKNIYEPENKGGVVYESPTN